MSNEREDRINYLERRLGYAEGLIAALDVELLRYSHPTWSDSQYLEYWNRLIENYLEPKK
jgi:hypothetical protein